MNSIVNPVNQYYSNYVYDPSLPVIECSSYIDVLNKAKNTKSSCILVNTSKSVEVNKNITINLNFSSNSKVVLIMNLELKGKSNLVINGGGNYTLSNISILDGDKSYNVTNHIVDISAPNITFVNFSMISIRVSNDDVDYFRVRPSGKNFSLFNSIFDGKYNKGVFLRFDIPYNAFIESCVFRNFEAGSFTNGGEMIRLSTSDYENTEANAVINQCYFFNCNGDPETLSVKCSGNTVKNCIFEKCSGRLVLRHAHKIKVDNCLFSECGMRVYGTDHVFTNIQLNDNAAILLDNKKGNYVPSKNITVNNVYYKNTKTPITNRGTNCKVTNVIEGIKITKNDLFTVNKKEKEEPPKPIEEEKKPKEDDIPKEVKEDEDEKPTEPKKYSITLNLTKEQIESLQKQLDL
jgi:hypothetical protein